MWEVAGTTGAGRVYRASSDALSFAISHKVNDEFKALVTEITAAQLMLLTVVEGCLAGLLFSTGRNIKEYFGTDQGGPEQ